MITYSTYSLRSENVCRLHGRPAALTSGRFEDGDLSLFKACVQRSHELELYVIGRIGVMEILRPQFHGGSRVLFLSPRFSGSIIVLLLAELSMRGRHRWRQIIGFSIVEVAEGAQQVEGCWQHSAYELHGPRAFPTVFGLREVQRFAIADDV